MAGLHKDMNQDLTVILNKTNAEIIEENITLMEEFDEEFGESGKRLLHAISVESFSYKPTDIYLEKITDTTERYFMGDIYEEGDDISFRSFFEAFDVSESVRGVFEGIEKEIDELFKTYDKLLEELDGKIPGLYIKRRYSLSNDVKKYFRLFLKKSFLNLVEDFSFHQNVLRRAIIEYNNHAKQIKDLKSARMVMRLTATFLGGIPASLAVSGAYEYMISKETALFEKELLNLYHSWYILQNSDLFTMHSENYRPRVHHLYLSTITGLLLSVQKELRQIGYQITEVKNDFGVSLGLTEKKSMEFFKKLTSFLTVPGNHDLSHDINLFRNFISVMNHVPVFDDLDEMQAIEIKQKVLLKYLELQTCFLKEYGEMSDVLNDLNKSFYQNGCWDAFSFHLDHKEMLHVNTIISELMNEEKSKWNDMYSEFIKVNALHKGYLLDTKIMVLQKNVLNDRFIEIHYWCGKNEFMIEDWSSIESSADKIKMNHLKKEFDKKYNSPKMRILEKLNLVRSPINPIISENTLFEVNSILSSRKTDMGMLKIDESIFVHPGDKIFYSLYNHFKASNFWGGPYLDIDNKVLKKIVYAGDTKLLFSLLDFGVGIFHEIDDSKYLFYYVLMYGSPQMITSFLDWCLQNIKTYDRQLSSLLLKDGFVSPYYYIFATGNGNLATTYSRLLSSIPIAFKRKEYDMACTSSDELNLVAMTLSPTFDPLVLKINEENDINPIVSLGINNRYKTMRIIEKKFKGTFEQQFQGRPLLYHFYEIGCIGTIDFYFNALGISEFGGVSQDDIQDAIWKTQNRDFLREMNDTVTGVEEIIENELSVAREQKFYVIEKMLKDILNNK
ncbi:hypothetical protein [Exiguobacterium sp. R-17]|uniref:hypothetical protein n=1 Tax=Exiguobacterium sp. R-17 TaxID=3404054 RepID=UPI003CEEBCF9